MRNGREQVVLHADLTEGTLRREVVPASVVSLFFGGRGIGDWLLWRDLRPGVDPLGPENVLVFSPGVLCGTNAPTAGRSTPPRVRALRKRCLGVMGSGMGALR